MSAIKLHVIKPSVNNMTARVFVRAAKLDFTEDDVYGKTRIDEFLARNPGASDADDGSAGPAEGRDVGELRDHAVSLQQASSRQVLSDRAGKARDGRQRDVLYRRHALSLYRALDLSARWASRTTRARSARATPTRRRRTTAQKAAAAAVGETLDVFRKFYLDGQTFIGGDHVSIADIRLACSLEFLHAIDYPFPEWLKAYMSAVETALGDAYAEPAGDVRGVHRLCEGAEEVGRNQRRGAPNGATRDRSAS